MGSDNSKPKTMSSHKKDLKVLTIAEKDQALQLQQLKEEYDAKYMEFIKSQMMIHQSIIVNQNRSSTFSSPTVSSSPSTSSYVSTLSENINDRNIVNKETKPKCRLSPLVSSAPPTSSCISSPSENVPHNVRSSTISPSPLLSIPSTSSNVVTQYDNINRGNISKTGAIPKSRTTPDARKNIPILNINCVTCENYFDLQIFQCENGHSSCNFCKFLNKNCGRCSKPITNLRNIMLEATFADTKLQQTTAATKERIKCHNARDGCCLSFTINEMNNHLLECPYSDMECPFKSICHTCTWKGNINNIYSHFMDNHPDNCVADVNKEMTLKNINKDQTIAYHVKIGFFNFIIYIEVNKNNNTISMMAQLLGTQVSASKWTYEFVIYDKSKPQRKFMYVDVCYSKSASAKEIFSTAKCAVVTTQYAKTFLNKGCLAYKFFIKQNAKNKYHT
ncbi:E3 ubiquitin-protein ligase sina-like isoform X2 [Nymphalis io]|uniref:E3 ubiquitin-protein ligase sina-like isoform X2 n=1 Tax=Inachis io TaxID=171585 RepID=UPI0021693CDF|nr:E3 ubiquitin-protein ligase sina-like isoform X2 [Nymphalis io]